MTSNLGRRGLLQAGATLLGAAMMPGTVRAQAPKEPGKAAYEFMVKDLVYQRSGDKARLARLYQPSGSGPFPAVLQVHGGAWTNKNRTDGQNTALDMVSAGIVVLSIDFRNSPEAPYPASLQDINYGIRWLKAHAGEFGSSADRVGAYGTSSGGHQALLAALRPDDPRYRALPLAEAPDLDAKLAFVVSGWGVLFPLERYKLAKAAGRPDLTVNHDTFFGDEATQLEATPALIIAGREGLSATCPGLPGHQGRMDHGRARPALRHRLSRRRRHARFAAVGGRAPHLRQRASVRAQLGEGGRDVDSLHQEIRLLAAGAAVT